VLVNTRADQSMGSLKQPSLLLLCCLVELAKQDGKRSLSDTGLVKYTADTDLDCILKGSILYVGAAGSTVQLIMLQVHSKLMT